MKKILFVEDILKRRVVLRTLLKLYNYDTYILPPHSLNELIQEEAPDFVYLDIKEPADGEDVKSVISNLKSDHRLRVRIIRTDNHKIKLLNALSFETFDNIVNSVVEKAAKTASHIKR